MNKVAMYVRVSSLKQQKEETIESQKDSLLKFARQCGFEVPHEWIFEDNGFSGETMIRPALEKLRDLAPEFLFDTILIASADRLARNYAHQYILIEEFKKSNVSVKFLNTPDQSTPENKLLLQLQGMFKKKAGDLKKKISTVENEINRLLDAYQENCIELEELKTRMSKLKNNKNNLKNDLDRIGLDGLTKKKMLDLKDAINVFSNKVNDSADDLGVLERREIVRALVKEVVVYPEEVIIKHVVPISRPGGEQLENQNARLCTDSQRYEKSR